MKSFIAAAGLLATANAYQPGSFFLRRSNETIPSAIPSISDIPSPSAIPSVSDILSSSDIPSVSAIPSSDIPSISDFLASSAIPESSAPAGFTTLTVEVTEVATITSCAPTITDCAAALPTLREEDLETFIITQTVRLTETVCPITEVENISESVIREHETGTLTGSIITSEAPSAVPSLSESSVPPQTTTSDAIPGIGEDAAEDECPAEDEDDEDDEDDEEFEDECPAEDDDEEDEEDEEDVVIIDKTVTVEPIPYPTGSALPSSGFAQPTGAAFVRRSRFRPAY
ncbi:hypothetical protein SODALDRAFT_15240 [Sodiomyces alkalinus F11]|uniref:Uncharacterized protein n=1 Tax=Sodiomyces alkalinus (strain CBS 110278 / VKM F-3762 / F11) TaxID=1314773 RepID=A0A3N2Q6R8_SODAK|nr:hypothetical protein SODALDRAFT_15240 [Sodiomyces alkalinus F11]ROT42440.1 hypothetical protein SODALDRAFT_15240 [Sodiomyces alkalinus F11]